MRYTKTTISLENLMVTGKESILYSKNVTE